jgi:hypothetical protein
MEKRDFNAATLAKAFGARSVCAQEGVRAILQSLGDVAHSAYVAETRRRWMDSMQAVFGNDTRRLERGFRAIVRAYPDCAGNDPFDLLFAVQSYYALVVRFLVAEFVARSHQTPSPVERLEGAERSGDLLQGFREMESQFGWMNSALEARDLWAWCLDASTESLASFIRVVAKTWGSFDFTRVGREGHGSVDLLKTLYQDIFPRQYRHALGEYYTPDWLVEQLLDEVGYEGRPGVRLLDPACGSGGFLVAAIRRLKSSGALRSRHGSLSAEVLRRYIFSSVVGIDVNPLAVLTARANYLIAILDLLSGEGGFDIPVFWGDSILGRHDGLPGGTEGFDCVVGNPPWIAWDDLPKEFRQATQPLWRRYGLFTLSAADARHGGAKKDLSMLMIYAAADRYLKSGGRLAMVVTQTVFQSRGAGDGFRRFRLGKDGEWLKVLRVNDLVECRPFPGTSNWSATLLLQKGTRTVFPVPYVKYFANGDIQTLQATPIDPNQPTSPWLIQAQSWGGWVAQSIGPSHYEAHLGANTGGANGVYWVTWCGGGASEDASRWVRIRNLAERGKQRIEVVEHWIEPELLFPLLRWGDVARFSARPSAWIILPQDVHLRRGIAEPILRENYPQAHAYLSRFREFLENRAAYRRYQSRAAFYSMYDVGPYTVAPFKVVWRRMDHRIRAAVLEPFPHPSLGPRPVVPQETCALVAADSADEAHYLCAILNSSLIEFLVESHNVRGGKGFGSPGMFEYLRIARYDPNHTIHRALAAASKTAHGLAAAGGNTAAIESEINAWVSELWETSPTGAMKNAHDTTG